VQSVRPNSARIAWTTKSRGEGWVEFVESPGEDSAWRDAPANSQLFKKKKTGDKKKYRAYEASLDTLAPDTWYCYRVKEDGETLASGLAFHTSWIGGYRPLRILAFGDTGTRHQAQYDIRDRIAEMDFDVMLHTGDIAYPKGSHRQFEKNFFNIYNPTTPEQGLLHRVPVFPVIGNNDYKTKMGEPFQDVFYLPEVAARPQDQELYYSFDYGNVHFVALDSNKQLRQSGGLQPMLGWLEADLASTPQPWKIAYFHHPPFTSVPGEAKTEVARHLVPVLERHGVDLVLMGHVHGYERTEPIRIDAAGNATADEEGIPYVVTGGGGGVDEPTGATASHVTEVFADNQPHFMQLTVTGCDMVGLAIDPQGALVDSFHLRGCD
jgi:predicted phosphodiesterase